MLGLPMGDGNNASAIPKVNAAVGNMLQDHNGRGLAAALASASFGMSGEFCELVVHCEYAPSLRSDLAVAGSVNGPSRCCSFRLG